MDRIVLVGAGRSSDELVLRLSRLAPVTVVDIAREALTLPAAAEAAHPVRPHAGDGTSRIVLEDLRGEQGDAVALVAATGNDRATVEICRIASELAYKPVVALVNAAPAGAECEKLGASPIVKSQLVGQIVEHALEQGAIGATSLYGFGRGEVLEFRVLPSSPAIGVPLAQLHAEGWRVAAIHRGEALVLPTGATALLAEDRVLLVGDPRLLAHAAETLRVGLPTFPLLHGPNVVVYLPSGRDASIEDEADVLTRHTRAARAVRLHPGAVPTRSAYVDTPSPYLPNAEPGKKMVEDAPLEGAALAQHVEAIRSKRPGVVVAKPPPRSFTDVILGRAGAIAVLCNGVGVPVLFPKGSPIYARVVLAVSEEATDFAAAEVALDLARMFGVPFAIMRVKLPGYLGTSDASVDALVATVQRRAQLHGMRAEAIALEGNPIREWAKATRRDDLCVLSRTKRARDSYTSPDLALRLARASTCSVLVCTSETR